LGDDANTRDLALRAIIESALNATISTTQLETDFRTFARDFETRPYKIGDVGIDWEQVPQERIMALFRVIQPIIAPAHEAFAKGEISVEQAALKIAPFVLIGRGFGIESDDPDPRAQQRAAELMSKISDYAAP
jgi:hypothetical protein